MNVNLDSLTLNATLAALDERLTRLVLTQEELRTGEPSQSREYALECVEDAIRDTSRARVAFGRSLPDDPVLFTATNGTDTVIDAIDEYKADGFLPVSFNAASRVGGLRFS